MSINTAIYNGFIQVTGKRANARVCYNGETKSRAGIGKGIALTALGNQYTSPTHTKKCKAVLRHGEFRLIAPESDTSAATMQHFTIQMMKAVVFGKKWLDFKVKTPHINTLAIIAGGNATDAERLESRIAAGMEVKFSATVLPNNITDEAFLTAYKQAIDKAKPQFVFILCYDRIRPHIYTEAQLAKEMAIYSKKKGICTIAETDIPKDRCALELNEKYWSISKLVNDSDRDSICDEHGVLLPTIYSFQGSVEGFDFLCRFQHRGNGEFCKASSSEQQRAFLIGTFYYANNTAAHDIDVDCTGRPLTENVIRQAQKAKLIDVRCYGKSLMESYITFKGEK